MSDFRFGCVISETSWGWRIGLSFCIAPKDMNGNRETYLTFCLGKYAIIIGFLDFYED